jgi:hypothetical protein
MAHRLVLSGNAGIERAMTKKGISCRNAENADERSEARLALSISSRDFAQRETEVRSLIFFGNDTRRIANRGCPNCEM